MSVSIIICPGSEKNAPIFFTTSPVTQTALLAVKSASKKGIEALFAIENGIDKSKAPIKLAEIKLNIII